MVTTNPKYKGPVAQLFSGMNNGIVRLPAAEPFKYTPVSTPEGGKILTVEGFASTDNVDRGNEVVDPSKFDLNQIETTTAVLVNHKLWMDRRGNPVAPGDIKNAYHVKVRKGSDAKSYKLYDVQGKTVLKDIAKRDFPGISIGDQGLYVIIEIYDPDVIDLVENGQLQAYSWRGHVKKENEFDIANGTRFVTYSLIDCWEISLVNVPVNSSASLVVRKSAISAMYYGDSLEVSEIKVDLKRRDLADFDLLKSDLGYYAVPQGFELIRKSLDSFIETPIGNGLTMLISMDDEENSTVESFKSLFSAPNEEESPVSEATQEKESVDTAAIAEVVKSQIMGEIGPMFSSQNEVIKSLTENQTKLAETVTGFDSKFDEISKSLTTLTASKEEKVVEPAKVVETPKEVTEEAKSEETVLEASKTSTEDSLKASLAEIQKNNEVVQKNMAMLTELVTKGLGKLVPNKDDRDEDITDKKKERSVGSTFNSVFGLPKDF